jgi:nucleoside phosphorylase
MSLPRSYRQLECKDYTVAWISPLPLEKTAATVLLDGGEDDRPIDLVPDGNSYVFGCIYGHNVAIASLPNEGTPAAATVVARMLVIFKSIKFGLLVGIGGGVPSTKHEIRLGDVVVSTPMDRYGGVVEYDHKKTLPDGKFTAKGLLNRPHDVVLNPINDLRAKHDIVANPLKPHLDKIREGVLPKLREQYKYPGKCRDPLLSAQCVHGDNTACVDDREVAIHYGTIASGNQLMRDAEARDAIARDREDYKRCDILCFEMEGAGAVNQFSCLVIRGISDYADCEKNDDWQRYASATAAAYAKALLENIVPAEVPSLPSMKGTRMVTPVDEVE